MKFNEKDYEYYNYIIEHKRNLMKSFDLFIRAEEILNGSQGSRLTLLEIEEIQVLKDRILIHDLSKFSKEEFEPYRKYFFPTKEEEKEANHMGISAKCLNESSFNLAWKHHYENNPHHPENHTEKMSKIDMVEMCLDWTAMGIKFNDSSLEYFRNKKGELEKQFGDIIDYSYVENILIWIDFCIRNK